MQNDPEAAKATAAAAAGKRKKSRKLATLKQDINGAPPAATAAATAAAATAAAATSTATAAAAHVEPPAPKRIKRTLAESELIVPLSDAVVIDVLYHQLGMLATPQKLMKWLQGMPDEIVPAYVKSLKFMIDNPRESMSVGHIKAIKFFVDALDSKA